MAETIPDTPTSPLLALPLELRLEIYANLLVLPSPFQPTASPEGFSAGLSSASGDRSQIQANILRTCRQIHREATPLLYRGNMWLAHPNMLTSFPRLRPWFGPLTQSSALRYFKDDCDLAACTQQEEPSDGGSVDAPAPASAPAQRPHGGAGRWHLRLRLDCGAPWDSDKAAAAFSGADELLVECWQSAYKGAGPHMLKKLSKVRGVRTVRVYGSVYAFQHYAAWLEDTMRQPIGAEVEPYVRPKGLKERELPSKLPGEESDSDSDSGSSSNSDSDAGSDADNDDDW